MNPLLPDVGSAGDRPASRRRGLIWAGLAAGMLAALLLDGTGYRLISVHHHGDLGPIEFKDLYRLLRIAGYWPTWLLIAAAAVLVDRRSGNPDPLRRGVLLAAASGLSGFAAELVKIIVGRMRPEDTAGALRFMEIGERASHWSDLSMPSSHAAVAFGAAVMGAWLWRGSWPVLLAVAIGCGLTRVLAGAHFVSDVYAAAVLAYAVAGGVWRLDARNHRPRPGPGAGAA